MTNAFVPPQKEMFVCRHRKNLAEWLLYFVLLPFVPICWVANRLRRK